MERIEEAVGVDEKDEAPEVELNEKKKKCVGRE